MYIYVSTQLAIRMRLLAGRVEQIQTPYSLQFLLNCYWYQYIYEYNIRTVQNIKITHKAIILTCSAPSLHIPHKQFNN